MSMPAPPPRSSRLSSGAGSGSDAGDGSPMDTTDMIDAVDFGAISAGHSGGKAEENRWAAVVAEEAEEGGERCVR